MFIFWEGTILIRIKSIIIPVSDDILMANWIQLNNFVSKNRAIREPSVIVLDNASYHNPLTPETKAPTSSWRKEQIQQWLRDHNVPFHDLALKKELMSLVKLHKPKPVSFHVRYNALCVSSIIASALRSIVIVCVCLHIAYLDKYLIHTKFSGKVSYHPGRIQITCGHWSPIRRSKMKITANGWNFDSVFSWPASWEWQELGIWLLFNTNRNLHYLRRKDIISAVEWPFELKLNVGILHWPITIKLQMFIILWLLWTWFSLILFAGRGIHSLSDLYSYITLAKNY